MYRNNVPKTEDAKDVRNSNETPTEKDLGQQKHYGSFRTALKSILYDYSKNSTINGVKYIGERQRPWTERILWIVALGTSIIFCCGFIWSSYKKWQDSPVIVTFADKSTPIWQIPFPAVTICPETKVTKNAPFDYEQLYSDYIKRHHNLTGRQLEIVKAIFQTCDLNIKYPELYESDPEIFANYSFVEIFGMFAPRRIFSHCQRRDIRSCKHFVPILTEEGICYTYNMLNASDMYREPFLYSEYVNPNHENASEYWTLEDGYKSHAPLLTYPERALGHGIRGGLDTELELNKSDNNYYCRGRVQGFKVLLHSPDEIPRVSTHYIKLDVNQQLTVSVQPRMFTTSDGLKHYDAIKRLCYFNHEYPLKFFKIYNQRNCELECLTLYTLEKCGCVRFSMPHEEETPICGIAKMGCYWHAEYELLRMEIMNDLSKDTKKSHCNCLPACTSIVYDAETSSTEFSWMKYSEDINNRDFISDDERENKQLSSLLIFFKETEFITSRRSELYGLTDFIANCGGLLGLFMGFSILSIVEIIYFCSIRLFCNLRRRSELTPSPVNDQND